MVAVNQNVMMVLLMIMMIAIQQVMHALTSNNFEIGLMPMPKTQKMFILLLQKFNHTGFLNL